MNWKGPKPDMGLFSWLNKPIDRLALPYRDGHADAFQIGDRFQNGVRPALTPQTGSLMISAE